MTSSRGVPTLQTERLTLRGHVMADFEPYAAALGSDHAAFVGGPMNQKAAWSQFCRDVAQWALLGHGAFAIDDRENGAFLGQISLSHHPYFPELEIGWFILPNAQGKGAAHEAARAVRDWAYGEGKSTALVSYIHRDNARSIGLAERLGAAPDKTAAPPPYPDHLVYRHPGPEALQ